MPTMVCFRCADATYCLPVETAKSVRAAAGMIALPAVRPRVVGIIPGDPPLTVISPFGESGRYVLVVEAGGKEFGLLVDTVTGLRRIDDADIRTAPHGQDRLVISGTVDTDGELTLVTDPTTLAAQL
ncbi:MAG TPA: chemotaxis protein CheW [Amycolatopsis sp.]|nr:chemotaxis protein CheW [Amycolatopsis sp.]